MEPVLLERDGALATVSINRPEARNALDPTTKPLLRDLLAEVAADTSVRAVVLTGTGGAFCAGQDLAAHARTLHERGAEVFDTVADEYAPVITTLATMPKPVVAAVEGACAGAGLGLALACDLRVLSRAAKLTTAFSGVGLTTDSGVAHFLPRMVGDARARRLVLLAEVFTGAQAVEWGIDGQLVEPGTALSAAQELGRRLAAGPTLAYAESKRLLADSWDRDLPATLAAEGAAQYRAGATRDHADAVAAFLAKQRPTFQGR